MIPLKPEKSNFTDGQWQAIYDTGTNILVSASAGSGKTTVLVERVIEKVKAGVNIDELLIVTYTEAAAKEMKARIERSLKETIQKERDSVVKKRYIHQLTLLPSATISTLHAFCLQVIRRYYYFIHLDPVFRLLTDETEMLLLKEDVWGELREKLYGEEEELFYQLTENFSNDRSDEGFTQLVLSLYEFARANPNPTAWLQSLKETYQVENGIEESSLYQKVLKPDILMKLHLARKNAKEMERLVEGEEELEKTAQIVFNESQYVKQLLEMMEKDQLEDVYHYLETMEFVRFAGAKRSAEEAIKEVAQTVKQKRDENKRLLTEMKKGLFAISPQAMIDLMSRSAKLVQKMSEVVQQFDHEYRAKKREKGVLDFNDLEHYTLEILAHFDQETETWHANEASNHYREKFAEVLIDEYQDINKLQESILYWLRNPTKDQGNLFMVGDIKQSIYSFRLADPTLFLEKYVAYEKEKDGRRIILAENFRSRKEVLDFTNLVFMQLMNTPLGQMEYDADAQLVLGYQEFPEDSYHQTELLIYESGKDSTEEIEEMDEQFVIDDRTEGELMMVGQKIKELMESKFPIYDKKEKRNRPIRYEDIVLLTPTKKNNLVLLDVLQQFEIPLKVNDTQNYFQATEIRIMMALLSIIDNPYQDIPLVSVLRSPIVGLGENELAIIRVQDKANSFYEALLAYHQQTNVKKDIIGLRQKVDQFLSRLQRWRTLARNRELMTLIWTIYEETGFLDYVGGLPSGLQRQANLHALYERAKNYEETSYKGLFQFVRFIDKMQEKDKDLAEPNLSGEENAVRVMTIHASKGLEFPVVFVLDMTRRFNLSDIRRRYLFDEQLGAGIHYIDPKLRKSFTTLPMFAIKEVKKKRLLSEEMRKLYVALTRSEEKLFLVGSYKDQETAWKEWSSVANEEEVVLSESSRLSSQHLMKWVGMTLIRHPDAKQDEWDTVKIPVIFQHPAHFQIHFYQPKDFMEKQTTINELSEEKKKQPQSATIQRELKEAYSLLNYQYANQVATHTTSYQSVSELKRVFEDPDQSELHNLEIRSEKISSEHSYRFVQNELEAPAFLNTASKVSYAEIGTATHLIMQRISLKKRPILPEIKNLLAQLVQEKAIVPEIADKIDLEAIEYFFESHLGQALIENEATVQREQPFSMLLQANEIFSNYPKDVTDSILVHGIIDGYFLTDKGYVLYDFKTDYIQDPEDKAELANVIKKYKGQLTLYQKALEESKGKKVCEVWIILLSAKQTVNLLDETTM